MDIQVTNLTKVFGHKAVLKDVNLTIQPNTIYGLLGRNGAGKSTLFNLLTNRLNPTSGNVLVDGQLNKNHDQALGRMYLMSEANLYPPRSRVSEVFELTETLYGQFDQQLAKQLCQRFDLDPRVRVNKLSTGYRSIMKLIVALAVDVDFVFLDEPTLGLDANHRELFYQLLIENYSQRPRTFVISTHLIEEIANMVERVFVLQNGQLTVDDSTEAILAQSYAITGPKADVTAYTAGTNIIGQDQLGHLYVDYVYGPLIADRPIPDTVTVDHIDLQKLFVTLTSQKGGADAI